MRVAVIACLAAPALGFIGAPVPLARRGNAPQAEREVGGRCVHESDELEEAVAFLSVTLACD